MRLDRKRTWIFPLVIGGAALVASLLTACGNDSSAAPAVRKVGLMHVGLDHVPPSLGGIADGLAELGWTLPQGEIDRCLEESTAASKEMKPFELPHQGRAARARVAQPRQGRSPESGGCVRVGGGRRHRGVRGRVDRRSARGDGEVSYPHRLLASIRPRASRARGQPCQPARQPHGRVRRSRPRSQAPRDLHAARARTEAGPRPGRPGGWGDGVRAERDAGGRQATRCGARGPRSDRGRRHPEGLPVAATR